MAMHLKPKRFRRKKQIKIFEQSVSSKLGLPPGTPVHVGRKRAFQPYATLIRYHGEEYEEITNVPPQDLPHLIRNDCVNWINVEGIHDVAFIQALAAALDIHPLTQEDIVNTQIRPQFETYPNYHFAALEMLYLGPERQLLKEHVSLVLKDHVVISFQETPGDVFGRIRERIRAKTGLVRLRPAAYLVYMLIDSIVDGYYQVVENLSERIELLDDDIHCGIRDSHLNKIYELKRETLFLRKNIFPVRDVLSKIQVEGKVFQDSRLFLQDLSTHIIQVTETLNLCMEMIAALTENFHAMMNQRMNAVMKTLTMMSTVFLPLNLIAGIYGMNFQHIPELRSTYGYPIVLGVMLSVAIGMMIWFVKKGWLLQSQNNPPPPSNGNNGAAEIKGESAR